MKNIKFAVGIITGHIIWYIINFDQYTYNYWFFDIIVWGYLLYTLFQKQKSKLWESINQWLIPINATYCVIQLTFYLIWLLGDSGLNLLLYPLWLYRFTLILEIPLAYLMVYSTYKDN